MLGWAVIGSVALNGHAETGNLIGWALLSLTTILVQLASTRLIRQFSLRVATSLRERLLASALQLEPDRLSSLGLGGLVVVAGQVDTLVASIISLFLAAIGALTALFSAVLVLGAAPLPAVTLSVFAGFFLAIAVLAPRVARRYDVLQKKRIQLTTDMVERMVGHRTRLVQQTEDAWHEGEDDSVYDYGSASRAVDRYLVIVRALPRGYYAVSLVVVFFVLVAQPTQQALALSLGGLTLGMAALAAVGEIVSLAGGVHATWKAVRPFVWGNGNPAESRRADVEIAGAGPVVELRGACVRYEGRSTPALAGVDVAIDKGDRVLIEGPSGGGKTTLTALLAGLRQPTDGLVLIRGLDQHTVRAADRSKVIAAAPQFCKNHIFTNSLAFNLLLGRAWPAAREDLHDAMQVARALGLGPLLERMPAGLFQAVGATGWQLSHGEQSRVYLARALLQRAEVVVLDETFDALDPASLELCMKATMACAQTLVVVTHR